MPYCHKESNSYCAKDAINFLCSFGTMPLMGNMLKTYREKKGLTQEALAELANTNHSTIGRLENGKRDLDEKWRRVLAPILGVHPANLLYPPDELLIAKEIGDTGLTKVNRKFESLPLIGKVEAGVFSEATLFPEDERKYYSLPVSLKYPNYKRFCLEVRGNSMNLEFPPGSLVICIDMIELGEDPLDGEIYVVDHIVHDEVESTLKELRIMPDGTQYLWPRSDDPEHQQPIKLNGNEGEEIRLRAKVVGDYQER